MLCVSCGHCCKTMSPINGGYCPLLKEEESPSGTVFFCGDYKNRPQQCRDHDYPAIVCPIGANTLSLINESMIRSRMNDVYSVIGGPFSLSASLLKKQVNGIERRKRH